MYEDRLCLQWVERLKSFVDAGVEDMQSKGGYKMCCPCVRCCNRKLHEPEDVEMHLLMRGFLPGYSRWTSHGEDGIEIDDDIEMENLESDDQPGEEAYRGEDPQDVPHGRMAEMLDDQHLQNQLDDPDDERVSRKFEKLREDAETPLYDNAGVDNSVLEVTLELLRIKAKHNIVDSGFTEILSYLRTILPPGNNLPKSTYEAKKVTCPLGLEVIRYHACPLDCIIYKGEYKDMHSCPICQTSRYKKKDPNPDGGEEEEVKRGPAAKTVWYLPCGTRLERWFQNEKEARWFIYHDATQKDIDPEGVYRNDDGVLRHPADAAQWRTLDDEFPEFGAEPRNIRFGMSTDGINPFGNLSSKHSTWPVILFIYNLPPWLVMKRKYIHLSMLIQGPKQPGADLNVYLELLKDELKELWETGRKVWDAHKKEEFTQRAALLTCVHDYPANGNSSCMTTKGYKACTKCGDGTEGLFLPESKKIVYMGHRKWLEMKDPWRNDKKNFNGRIERRQKPRELTGHEVYEIVRDLEVVAGKAQPAGPDGLTYKRRSVFWDLPYWRFLQSRHTIDVMHVEKNVCDSLLGLMMHHADKSKDGPKSRNDLQWMGIREELWPIEEEKPDENKKGERTIYTRCKPACYSMSKAELHRMCECLHGIKVPSNYSSNIKKLVDIKSHKLVGMKSHDCHVILTQLLPVAIRGCMEPWVRETVMKLCDFFDTIGQKSITVDRCLQLRDAMIQILCECEMFFPPTFFDIMVHLMVHIADEILLLGPSFLHNMFGPERYNGVLKRYVRNRGRPEGSIIEGYHAEECVEFCTDWLADHKPIGVPESRHKGKLEGEGGLGRKDLDVHGRERMDDFIRAHTMVLQHTPEMEPFIDMHIEELRNLNPNRNDDWIQRKHNSTFAVWLKDLWYPRAATNENEKIVQRLSRFPDRIVVTYQSYAMNGYTYYTKAQDRKSTYQNSGIVLVAETGTDSEGQTEAYYGVVEEIWELDYTFTTIAMFRIRWARDVRHEDHRFTTMILPKEVPRHQVNVKRISALLEPWQFASKCKQVFFIEDPIAKNRVVVRRGKRSIVGVDGVTSQQDYEGFPDPTTRQEEEVARRTIQTRKKSKLPTQDGAYARSSHDEVQTYKRKEKTTKKKDQIVQ